MQKYHAQLDKQNTLLFVDTDHYRQHRPVYRRHYGILLRF